jgi:hypothetical protein
MNQHTVQFFPEGSVREHLVSAHGVESMSVAKREEEAESQHDANHGRERTNLENFEAWLWWLPHAVAEQSACG